MFREMRRRHQALPQQECVEILERNLSGVLAVSGDDGYPYAVPLSYVYTDGKLFFHCAKEGHKLDALRRSPKASFCVVARDEIVPEKYTTRFSSVIVFGTIRQLEDDAEKRESIRKLALKYAPQESECHLEQEIEQEWNALCVLEMTAEQITGKEGSELAKLRKK